MEPRGENVAFYLVPKSRWGASPFASAAASLDYALLDVALTLSCRFLEFVAAN